MSREATTAPFLSREATTALSHRGTDAPTEGVGVVWPGSGRASVSGCVGVAGLLSREATTALQTLYRCGRVLAEPVHPGVYVGGGEWRPSSKGMVGVPGLKRASAMAARAAAGMGAVGGRVAVWVGTRPGCRLVGNRVCGVGVGGGWQGRRSGWCGGTFASSWSKTHPHFREVGCFSGGAGVRCCERAGAAVR